MKTKLPTILLTLAISASSLPAANIAWVSFHAADDAPSGAAAGAGFTNAPDIGYTTLLTANGHNVTRFVRLPDLQNNPALIADLNTNDMVIVSRSVPSGDFDSVAETAAWNVAINVPLISLGGYINRANRLGFHTGNTIPDVNSNPMRLQVNSPGHPIFAGISLDAGNLTVNPYAVITTFTNANDGTELPQRGISTITDPVVAGGTILATVGTAGDAAFGGMVIGEFPAGTTLQRGDVLATKRLVFLTGSRELSITSEGSGIFDLDSDGATMFLNAVNYMIPPPSPPEITVEPVGATNLLAGESWTLTASVTGSNPKAYQWYKNGLAVPSGTDAALAFPSLVNPDDAGDYFVIVTNSAGSATSAVATLEFHVFPPTSITNGLISYWPLDEVLGTKTIDRVSGYDMSLANLSASDIVPGKWGNAFQMNGTNSLLSRINNPGDALPIYQHPEFSVSLWVNAPFPTVDVRDRRAFSEGSTTSGTPLFNIGTDNRNPPVDGSVDIYIRNDGNVVVAGDHRHSAGIAYDGFSWHHIAYVQRDIGNGNITAQLWVDGVLDSVVITPPPRPLTPNTTSIGGILRAAPSAWFLGMIDEVAVWNRALSSGEIGILQVTAITNPPSRLQPLTISSFKADLPAVVSGSSTTLRWDVSKDATQVTISPLGDVTAQTSVGIGDQSITQVVATTYVLTVIRGLDSISATTSVAAVEGVNPGWAVLDTFDQAQLGNLFDSGYWNDTSGSGGQVVSVNGNRALRSTSAGISFLNLQGLSVQDTQARTLFFRVIPGEDDAAGVTNVVGLTDKSQRGYGDSVANIGPVVYPTPFTNSAYLVETNGWYLGARNGWLGGNTSPLIDYYGSQIEHQPALESGAVYNVWVDITNAPLAEFASDTFTVYIQKEGGGPRTVLFQDYTSDRDPFFVDPVLGGITPNLDKLVVMGNSATVSAIFDDFYLSTGGYNATVPKPYTIVSQPGPLSVNRVGNQIQIIWTTGTLQSSANVTGPYVDVPGNPTSPYPVDPAGNGMFFRARQ